MKITDISADRNQVQSLETLSAREAIEIVGGDRGGPSDGGPPMDCPYDSGVNFNPDPSKASSVLKFD